jgi:hypothetical protein
VVGENTASDSSTTVANNQADLNSGGDVLDAVIAAVGRWGAWRSADHGAIARHPRYRREGHLYV